MNQLHEFMTISQSVPGLRQMRPCASKVMRPLTWALKNARPGRPTQAVRHKCSGNIGIVQILRFIRLYQFLMYMYTASATNSKLLYITHTFDRKMPSPPPAYDPLCLSTMVNPALITIHMIDSPLFISTTHTHTHR